MQKINPSSNLTWLLCYSFNIGFDLWFRVTFSCFTPTEKGVSLGVTHRNKQSSVEFAFTQGEQRTGCASGTHEGICKWKGLDGFINMTFASL